MQDRNKNIKVSLREILRYRKGEMKGKERNSFERELQKDPFAEEAQEGFEVISSVQASEDIEHLQKLIRKRTRGRRIGTGYRIAAAVAVLMIISSVFILIEKKNRPAGQIAMVEKPEMFEIDRSVPLQAPAESKPSEAFKEPERIHRSVENHSRINTEQSAGGTGNVAASVNQPAIQKDLAARAAKEAGTRDEEHMKVMSEAVPSAPDTGGEKKEVPTAGKARGISTAVVSYQQGYQPPHPAEGEQAFEKYIRENIRRPDSTGQRAVVVVEFIVRTDGTTDSLKIVRSPGEQFSEEAIRLIRKGPGWKPALQDGSPVEGKAQVKIIFP